MICESCHDEVDLLKRYDDPATGEVMHICVRCVELNNVTEHAEALGAHKRLVMLEVRKVERR